MAGPASLGDRLFVADELDAVRLGERNGSGRQTATSPGGDDYADVAQVLWEQFGTDRTGA